MANLPAKLRVGTCSTLRVSHSTRKFFYDDNLASTIPDIGASKLEKNFNTFRIYNRLGASAFQRRDIARKCGIVVKKFRAYDMISKVSYRPCAHHSDVVVIQDVLVG